MIKNTVLASLLLTLSLSAMAANKGNFDAKKQRINEVIEQQINILETHKECVENATNKKMLKTCKKTRKAAMKALRTKHKAERKARREARKAAKSDS